MRTPAILIATLLGAGPALAQPAFDWSGLYIGAHAGYGWGTAEHIDNSASFAIDGALAGGQIGINRQLGNFVFGLEGDAAWAGLRGEAALSNYFGIGDIAFTSRLDWLATLTGRVGVAQGASLIYAKGGVAWAGTDHGFDLVYTGPAPAPFDFFHRNGGTTHRGWTLGGGIEHFFAPRWSARVEYAFVGLPPRTVTTAGPTSIGGVVGTTTMDVNMQQALHLVRFGVNYHFGGPATTPAIAPTPAHGFDWGGFYVGAHAGYGAGRASWTDLDPVRHVDVGGGLAGGQFGLNLQVGRIVFGAELDFAWSGIDGGITVATPDPGLGATTLDLATRTDWLGTAAGRIGFAHDRWLVFAKAGAAAAWQRHAWQQTAPGLLTISTSGHHHHAGVLVGAGVEHALTRNWSVKAEYDFIDFGRETVLTYGTATGLLNGNVLAPNTVRQQLHLAKLGVNYRFAPP